MTDYLLTGWTNGRKGSMDKPVKCSKCGDMFMRNSAAQKKCRDCLTIEPVYITCLCGKKVRRKTNTHKYCSVKCRKAANAKPPKIATCTCGKEFEQKTKLHKYCSAKCRNANRKRPKRVTRKKELTACSQCNRLFQKKSPAQKMCTPCAKKRKKKPSKDMANYRLEYDPTGDFGQELGSLDIQYGIQNNAFAKGTRFVNVVNHDRLIVDPECEQGYFVRSASQTAKFRDRIREVL